MKVASTISRYLLGLIFFVFGLNGFLHFLPQPPMSGLAGQFMGAVAVSHYILVVMALQVIGGVLLLAGRFVPLGLVLLAPVIVNIFCFHAFMAPSGLPLAVITILLWVLTAWSVWGNFAPLLEARAQGAGLHQGAVPAGRSSTTL